MDMAEPSGARACSNEAEELNFRLAGKAEKNERGE
jgi:hypothetical protein